MAWFFCTQYLHSDMKVSRDAIVALARSGLNVGSISKRLKVQRTSLYRIIKKFTAKGNVDDEPRSDRPRSSRTKELVKSVKSKISRNPRRSLRKMAAEAGISPTSMIRLVHEDLKMTSFRTGRFLGRENLHSWCGSQQEEWPGHRYQCKKHIPDEYWTVTRQQKPASVMVRAAVSKTWKGPLILVQEHIYVWTTSCVGEAGNSGDFRTKNGPSYERFFFKTSTVFSRSLTVTTKYFYIAFWARMNTIRAKFSYLCIYSRSIYCCYIAVLARLLQNMKRTCKNDVYHIYGKCSLVHPLRSY